jgi:putative iron-regulated protein
VRSLPEVLRLAPGVDVARLSAGRWAVGVRGDTGRFSNKLQVLVDSAEKDNVHFDQLIAAENNEGQQKVRDAIAALVKQTAAIEKASATLGISDLNPDNADHEF